MERASRIGLQQEPVKVKTLPVPVPPTPQEIERHYLTHLPPAPWCVYCQLGKMKDAPHKKEYKEPIIPEVEIDFMYLNSSLQFCEEAASWCTTLVAVESESGAPLAIPMPEKKKGSPTWDYTLKSIKNYLGRLGLEEIRIKSDAEPVLLSIVDAIVEIREKSTKKKVAPR